jgi:phosphoribosyl 1,2-cyclic phosphodiesterase
VRVHLCGVRGSTPAPGADFVRYGGHTACIAIAHDGADAPTLILDTGTGVRTVTALTNGAPFAGTILYSHLHWDHVQGLPFFAAADNDGSQVNLFIPEPDPITGVSAEALLERSMSPPHFPVTPSGLRGNWSFDMLAPGNYEHAGFAVLAREVPHKGGRTFGYRVSDGHSTLTYIPDHSPTRFGVGEGGFGAYHPAAVELANDADALIHDSQLLPDEFIAESDFGHSVADYAVGLGRHANTSTVVLFHHAPDRTDDQLDALGDRFEHSPGVIVGAQGNVLEL